MSWNLPKPLRPIAAPAAWVYGRAVAARNARFDAGKRIERIDRPVISIGNITTGGTGKTPFTAWISRMLVEAGHRPVIAMRGYRAPRAGMSDEQAEYAELIPDVPVIAHPQRAAALRDFLPKHADVDCVLLDDGFQHRQLHRDLDLVLIDASADTFNDALLPAGNLREPLANLRRADAVIITHAPRDQSQISNLKSEISHLKSQIQHHHRRPPLAASRHIWARLDVFQSANNPHAHEIDWLKGKRIITMLGIGNQQSVQTQLRSLGASVSADIPARDHQHYTPAVMAKAANRVRSHESDFDALLVTNKDWVKLRSVIDWSAWRLPIIVPRLEIDVFEGERALRELILNTVKSSQTTRPAPAAAH